MLRRRNNPGEESYDESDDKDFAFGSQVASRVGKRKIQMASPAPLVTGKEAGKKSRTTVGLPDLLLGEIQQNCDSQNQYFASMTDTC
jgi:hypothetical protein